MQEQYVRLPGESIRVNIFRFKSTHNKGMQSQFETKLIHITDFILDLIKSHFDNIKITLHKKTTWL